MVGQHLGLPRGCLREGFLVSFRDRQVNLPARLLRERLIRGIANQRMLEPVVGLRRRAELLDELRAHERAELLLELGLR